MNWEPTLTQLADDGYAVCKLAFPSEELALLLHFFEVQQTHNTFRQAGIGKEKESNSAIRRDHIFWLDEHHLTEDLSFLGKFLEQTKNTFNREFYAGINSYECHFAEYGNGAFYKKHLDQPKGSDNRVFTFILYLNEAWQGQDGGQLRMYLTNETKDIDPQLGTLVLFRSNKIEHEVLPTFRNRKSLTGWFLRNL